MEQRTCKVCGLSKPIDDYAWTGPKDRQSRRRTCKKCHYETYSRKYIESNRDKIRAHGRKAEAKRRAQNRDEILAYRRKRYADNIEVERTRARAAAEQRRSRDPKKVREYQRQWRLANPEKQKAISKRGYLRHRETHLTAARNRKRLLRRVEGSHTKAEWLSCVRAAGNRCKHCGISGLVKQMTRDHIIPITRGGTDYIDNIQPLCFSCNSRKNNRLESELEYLKDTA